jgi:hypothetical protein
MRMQGCSKCNRIGLIWVATMHGCRSSRCRLHWSAASTSPSFPSARTGCSPSITSEQSAV